jgi:hypothetical protein
MRNAIFLIIVVLFIYPVTSQAQELQLGLDLDVGIPQRDFSDQLGRAGVGLGISGGYQFPNTPVMLGLDFGFMNFGKDVREEPLSTTIPDLRVVVENRYNLVSGNLLFRLIPQPQAFRPYVEGLFGFNYFFTETAIMERGSFSGEDKLRDTNFEDVALSYGFGAGFQLRVYQDKVPDREETSPAAVYLTLASRYMLGHEAEYLRQGSIQIENGNVFYDVSRSKTDLLYFKFGVVISF